MWEFAIYNIGDTNMPEKDNMLLEIGHATGKVSMYGALAWAWLGENVSSITAACAIGGFLVNAICALIKEHRDRKRGTWR